MAVRILLIAATISLVVVALIAFNAGSSGNPSNGNHASTTTEQTPGDNCVPQPNMVCPQN